MTKTSSDTEIIVLSESQPARRLSRCVNSYPQLGHYAHSVKVRATKQGKCGKGGRGWCIYASVLRKLDSLKGFGLVLAAWC